VPPDFAQTQAITEALDELHSSFAHGVLYPESAAEEPFVLRLRVLCALQWRLWELASQGFNFAQTGSELPGAVLVRASMETAALQHSVVTRQMSSEEVGSIAFGTRLDGGKWKAPQILNFVDRFPKVEGIHFRGVYDELSEFVHPNRAGVLAHYSEGSGDLRKFGFFRNESLQELLYRGLHASLAVTRFATADHLRS
jgi:hypothetical protein